MEKFQTSDIPKSPRIQKLVDALYEHMPVIESSRAKLLTESYKETEGEPIITRRAKAVRIFCIIFRLSSAIMN